MKDFWQKKYFVLLLFALAAVALGIFQNDLLLSLFFLGFLLLVMESFAEKKLYRRILRTSGFLLIFLSAILARGFILLIGLLIIGLWVWRRQHLFELFDMETSSLFRTKPPSYHQIKVVEDQSCQRQVYQKDSLNSSLSSTYSVEDINLVYLGGDQIIDLGNTVLPTGETVIIIRKIFGRTRIVLPREVGVRLNVSALSGKILFDQELTELSSQQLTWQNANYKVNKRQIRLFVSVAFGDVEVIFL